MRCVFGKELARLGPKALFTFFIHTDRRRLHHVGFGHDRLRERVQPKVCAGEQDEYQGRRPPNSTSILGAAEAAEAEVGVADLNNANIVLKYTTTK